MAQTTARILIADDVAEECARILRQAGLSVDAPGKMKLEALREAVPAFDGLIVRSGVTVTREVIEAGARLKLIGRAGIGVDNIDVAAATRKGIPVLTAPLGNVGSAAEHTWALLLAMARNIPRAHGMLAAGKWERKGFTGVELSGKVLGIVGLGKVGAEVARFARAFGMEVLAFDPYLAPDRAAQLGVKLATLDEVLTQGDFITVHTPLTDKTRGLINASALQKLKKTARIVNTARGGIIEEAALAAALRNKEIAGAALDVFEQEPPPKDNPLLGLENVTVTPHLGASTEEAQLKVAVDIAQQFVEFFTRGIIRSAVNLATVSDPKRRPLLTLAEHLGGLAAQILDGRLLRVEIQCRGEIPAQDAEAIRQHVLKGVLAPAFGESVNPLNSFLLARERGIDVVEARSQDAGDYRSLVVVRVESDQGQKRVAGTLVGERESRIVEIDGLQVDLRPTKHMVVMFCPDRPGILGKFGTILGVHGINIVRMELGRVGRGQQAVMVLLVDDPVPAAVVDEFKKAISHDDIRAVTL